MSRNIITTETIAISSGKRDVAEEKDTRMMNQQVIPETELEDKHLSKLIKLIPADIVSVYLAVFNIIKGSQPDAEGKPLLQWIVFGLILCITPFYLRKVAGITSYKQIIFCTFSFVLWALSLGGPLEGIDIGGYTVQFLGVIVLPVYTLCIPFFYK